MKITTRTDALLNETCCSFRHSSGLEVFVVPKKHATLVGMLGTRYGSVDSVFRKDDETDFSAVPDGVAHFLEHKLFEDSEGGDATDRFVMLGGDTNAFTDFDRTCYYFTCTENYTQNLAVLLDFVTHPFFSDKSVAKEQGIIAQEIRMYDDDPNWRVYFGLLGAMYENNPVRIDTAGTVETISKITPEVLYRCYNTFYDLSNMTLVVCGDITPDEVEKECDKALGTREHTSFERAVFDEPESVFKKTVRESLEVAQPLYAIGFKDKPANPGRDAVKQDYVNSILIKSLFGTSSRFYEKHYTSGLINKSFGASYSTLRGAAYAIIEGSAEEPEKVRDAVFGEIEARRKRFIRKSEFERAKKTMYSSFLQSFDSTENIVDLLMPFAFAGVHIFDIPEIILSVTYEDCRKAFNALFREEKCSMSIIDPIGKE